MSIGENMKIRMLAETEDSIAENLIPGQSFVHNDNICIAVNRTNTGYLVRKLSESESYTIDKNESVKKFSIVNKNIQEL